MPRISTLANADNGIYIKWNMIDSCTGYAVLRKEGDGTWSTVAKIEGNKVTSYIDASVKNDFGKSYTYSVRARKDGYVSGYSTVGKTINRSEIPDISISQEVILDQSGIKIKIGEVSKLKATIIPASDKKLLWTCSDETIISVTAEGEVKGIKSGKATVSRHN